MEPDSGEGISWNGEREPDPNVPRAGRVNSGAPKTARLLKGDSNPCQGHGENCLSLGGDKALL